MKKIYLIIMILFTLFIVGCNTQPPITVIHPEIYEVEMYNNLVIKGEDLIKKFYYNTKKNQELILRIKQTITLDKDKVSKEYYEENKNNYPKEHNITVYYDKEKYIYETKDTQLTYLYIKMESTKGNDIISPTNDYTIFLTNDINMTYSDYILLLVKPHLNIDIEKTIKILFIKSTKEKITFGESKIDNIYYSNNDNQIEITEELEQMFFSYLDSLDWNTQESMTPQEKEKLESTQSNKNTLLISTTRVYRYSEYNQLRFQVGKDNFVQYRFYLDSGYVFITNGLLSTNIHDLYAKLDSFELAQILYKSNINIINKINNITYINPQRDFVDDCKSLTLQKTNEFIYYERAIYSTMIHGKYYVIGDALILLYKYPVGSDTIKYVEEFVIYEIEENKLIYLEGIVKTVFGKGLMGDLDKLVME